MGFHGKTTRLVQVFVVLAAVLCSGPLVAQARQNFSFAIIGDAGKWTPDSKRVHQSIASGGVRNLILPGDNIYDDRDTYFKIWSPWSKSGMKFSVVALGNHHHGYEEEMKFFGMPAEFYSRSDGTIRFLVLNSDNEKTSAQQTAWLDRELATASEPYLFVVYHHPSYTVGSHGWQEKREFQLRLRPVLKKYQHKITALLVGHDHIASLVELNRLPMVISGAVFESLPAQPVNYTEDGVRVKTKWLFRGGYYWTRLDVVPGRGEVWINFVSATLNRVTCSVRIAPRPLLSRPNCSQRL